MFGFKVELVHLVYMSSSFSATLTAAVIGNLVTWKWWMISIAML